MHPFRWLLILVFLAGPYVQVGVASAAPRVQRGGAELAAGASGCLAGVPAGRHEGAPASVPAYRSHQRYRCALLVVFFNPGSLAPSRPSVGEGRDQCVHPFTDDIFHPPA